MLKRPGALARHVRGVSTLAHAIIPATAPPAGGKLRTAVVIHGMLGSKKNWRSFTRRLLSRSPGWQALLVDLRGHGESTSMTPPHTVAACARDVARTVGALGLRADAVLGHSFGGKVALSLLGQTLFEDAGAAPIAIPPASHTWVLDSMPGRVPLDTRADDDSVAEVIRRMASIRAPIPSKEWLVGEITRMGFSKGLALWMTTNVEGAEGSYRWAFDLDVAWPLFQDYCSTTQVPTLHRLQSMHREAVDPRSLPAVTMVRAARNAAWTSERLAEIAPAALPDIADWQEDGLRIVELPNAGHWVHMDNPEGLAQTIAPSMV